MPADAIRTEAVTKLFGTRPAVKDVSLSVGRGSVYAFLGPNGAGKSTTIRMLLGLLRPSQGRIALFGLELAQHRSDILRRTGSLVESPSVYPHLTARDNLETTRGILGAPKSDIDRVLAIVGLAQTGGKLVKAFSLGMKQRLALAQAMIGARELLILDEPTNGLDPAGINEVRTLVRQLPGEHGITVFLSSHLLGEVEQGQPTSEFCRKAPWCFRAPPPNWRSGADRSCASAPAESKKRRRSSRRKDGRCRSRRARS